MSLSLPELQILWFIVFVSLMVGYAVLDGFDLGVGMLHLFTEDDQERRLMLNSIGPVWDGNEVWLVTAGGALFAGFPDVYATLCSAFYTPLMALLCALIFRAVAIEFRSKQEAPWWRTSWDIAFAMASLLIAFILGIALGNLIHGLPLDEQGEFIGTWRDLLHPYTLLVGLLATSLFAMHGSIYVVMKTEGALHDKLRSWIRPTIIFFSLTYFVTTMTTLIFEPHMVANIRERPYFFVLALLNVLAVANIPRAIALGRDGWAFASSCASIFFLLALFGVGTFPTVVRAVNEGDNSWTIFNGSSSEQTLLTLLFIALMGIPLVVAYTTGIYWVFRGKVRLDSSSY